MSPVREMYSRYFSRHRRRLGVVLCLCAVVATTPFVLGAAGRYLVDDVLELGQDPGSGDDELSRDDPRGPWALNYRNTTAAVRSGTLGDRQAGRTGKTNQQKIQLLVAMFFFYVLVHGVSFGLGWLANLNTVAVSQKVVLSLRKSLIRKMAQLQLAWFDRMSPGKLMARVMSDVSVIQQGFAPLMIQLVNSGMVFLTGTVVILWLEPRLGLIVLACLPFYALAYSGFRSRLRRNHQELRRRHSTLYGLIGDKISAAALVKAFVREKSEARLLFHGTKGLFRLCRHSAALNIGLTFCCTLISSVGAISILWIGVGFVQAGTLTLGELLFFYTAAMQLFAPVVMLTNMSGPIQGQRAVAERILDVLDEPVTIADTPGSVDIEGVKGTITFEDVRFTYPGAAEEALSGVSMEVPAGMKVAVLGSSGAGKTTLLKTLLRLQEPSGGCVRLDGVDLKTIRLDSLRRHVAYVPQEPILFSGTLAENIAYGQTDAGRKDIERAAVAAELHEFVVDRPGGYDAEVTEGGSGLSGGQKQRVGLARALLKKPSVLLLDDCTSALDADTEVKVQNMLASLEGVTIFIVTHRVSMAAKADRIVMMDEGRIIEQGTHDILTARRGAYRRMARAQMRSRSRAAA